MMGIGPLLYTLKNIKYKTKRQANCGLMVEAQHPQMLRFRIVAVRCVADYEQADAPVAACS